MPNPAHVPESRIFPLDIRLDSELFQDPVTYLDDIARRFPDGIYFSPKNGGHWVIGGYKAYSEAALAPEVFSSKQVVIPPGDASPLLIPINIDPPDHAKYRQAIAAGFSPVRMRKQEKAIREFAISLIEGIADRGECDFVSAVGEPLPITVFMNLVGLPLERLGEFRDWAMTALADIDPMAREHAIGLIMTFMAEVIEQRRENRGTDMISDLFDAQIDGRPLTMEEMQAYCLLFFLAGLDTVVNGMSFGIRHLAMNPDTQTQLRENPSLVPAYVEESLRRYSFVNVGRVLTRDTEFYGMTMKKGEMVMLSQAAANLDPEVFTDPRDFKLSRKGPKHVAFNTGPHVCLGAHLARIELAILYEE